MLRNSTFSKKFIPNNFKSDQILKENTEPSPTNQIINPKKADALERDKLNASHSQATPGSIRDIEEVHAAIESRRKNIKSRRKKKRGF